MRRPTLGVRSRGRRGASDLVETGEVSEPDAATARDGGAEPTAVTADRVDADDSGPVVVVTGRARMSRRRAVGISLVAVAVIVVGVVVLPTRALFTQRNQVNAARAQLNQITAQNAALKHRVDTLSDKDSIEQQARAQFGLVNPGEESYTVTPPQTPIVNLPPVWPFDLLQDPLAKAALQPKPAESQ